MWAMLARVARADEMAGARRYRSLLSLTVPVAVDLRHEPILALADGDEMVCSCGRCSALGYGNAAEDVVGGDLIEDECPNEEPPKLTALTMMHVSGSRWPRDSRASRSGCGVAPVPPLHAMRERRAPPPGCSLCLDAARA
jgi:hypothetical protein